VRSIWRGRGRMIGEKGEREDGRENGRREG